MKRYFFSIILLFVFSSCQTYWRWNIGQTYNEFVELNGAKARRLSVEKHTGSQAVYSAGNTGTPGANPLFFYFENGKLTRVDRGVYSPDVIIENR